MAGWHTLASTSFDPPMPRPAPPAPPESDDDGPTAAEAASHARALRGAAKLATEATTGLTDLVEAVHARIASVPGLPGPADGRTRGVTGLVYKTVRGVTRAVGGSVDTLLGALSPMLAAKRTAPTRRACPRPSARRCWPRSTACWATTWRAPSIRWRSAWRFATPGAR